jgi:F-type H+-transporting ATPase subunit b
MVSFNATLVVQVFNFFILLFLLDQLFFKKVGKILAERRSYLANAEKSVTEGLANLEEMSRQHQEQIDAARQTAQGVIAEQLAKAEAEKAAILASVRDELATQSAQQKAELSAQVAAAEAAIKAEVGSLAESIADKVMQVGRQPALR